MATEGMHEESVNDKRINCKDCNDEFVWTEKEQAFYQDKGLSAPKRCKKCRAVRKQARSQQ